MAYDIASLISTVRTRAKDTSFSSDQITDYLQSAQNEVLGRSRYPFMETVDGAGIADEADTEYTLDAEVEVILALQLVDPVTDQVVTPEYMEYAEFYRRFEPDVASASTPRYYTYFANKLVWEAPLDRDYTVKVKYIRTPIAFTSSAIVPDIPERFKEILIRGALAHIEEYRDNHDIAALHRQRVEELSEDMLSRLNLRQLATPHKSRFGRNRGDFGWGD